MLPLYEIPGFWAVKGGNLWEWRPYSKLFNVARLILLLLSASTLFRVCLFFFQLHRIFLLCAGIVWLSPRPIFKILRRGENPLQRDVHWFSYRWQLHRHERINLSSLESVRRPGLDRPGGRRRAAVALVVARSGAGFLQLESGKSAK